MIRLDRFLDAVEEIAGEDQLYREGGLGRDGTCDCVGLIMGALMRCGGKKWDMHSSNYAARYQMETLTEIRSEACCFRGMVVYKSRDGSGLNARYLPGGSHYNGDMQDHYHVGVVMSAEPFRLLHCTSGGGADGIVTDTKLGAWDCGGLLKGVDYSHGEETRMEEARVYSGGNGPVRMRERPSTSAGTVVKVSEGETVQVLEAAGEWRTVEWNGKHGYMMASFLSAAGVRDDEAQARRDELKEMVLEAQELLGLILEKLDEE